MTCGDTTGIDIFLEFYMLWCVRHVEYSRWFTINLTQEDSTIDSGEFIATNGLHNVGWTLLAAARRVFKIFYNMNYRERSPKKVWVLWNPFNRVSHPDVSDFCDNGVANHPSTRGHRVSNLNDIHELASFHSITELQQEMGVRVCKEVRYDNGFLYWIFVT
ncbi:hypothetical protein J6590_008341 [Homalodisca vitripennis]|nr:hypothetical protein J6590_008341 [Homalodisca vitripennis]